MSVKTGYMSFKEFYFLKESSNNELYQKIESKLNEVRNLVSSKIFSDENKIILNNLKKDLINLFKQLKTSGFSVVKNAIDELLLKKLAALSKDPSTKASWIRFLIAFIPNLIAIMGMYQFYKIRHPDKLEKITTPSYTIQQKSTEESEKLTKDIVDELNYGRFSDRVAFIEKIKTFEVGSKKIPAKAYADRTQVSIGYGTKAKEGEKELSVKDAHDRLIQELSSIEKDILNYLKSKNLEGKFNKDQISGIVDFSFNRGINKFKSLMNSSKNLKELTDKMKLEVGARTSNTEKPKVSKGLIDRRNFETDLILKNKKIENI